MTMQIVYDMPDADYRALPYTSQSEIKAWRACPAAWHAEYIAHTYRREESDAMLVGKLFEATVCEDADALAALKSDTRLYTIKDRRLRSEFACIDAMVATWRRQGYADISGARKQVTFFGECQFGEGVFRCKGRADLYWPERAQIADIKTAKNFADVWADIVENGQTKKGKVEWYHEYDYCLQAAYYMALEAAARGHGWRTFDLLAVSKETPPGARWVRMCPTAPIIAMKLAQIAEALGAMETAAQPGAVLRRCDLCDYCRGTAIKTEPEVLR